MRMSSNLLPETLDEFRSVNFWDGFFKSRGQKAFEWYGEWRQLKPFLARDCTPDKEVLVVGCGNSELSASLYDAGCQNITNLDFSKVVIASMMKKHLRQRPKMRWKIGDMTNLQFSEGAFQVVVDKGGLDALMGEDTRESAVSGKKLLEGVSHVTAPGGVYLCVSLAQPHVLRLLLDHFRQGWLLELHSVPPTPDMARSEVQPVFIRGLKALPGQAAEGSNICSIARAPQAPNAEHLDSICQILEEAAGQAMEDSRGTDSRQPNGSADAFDRLYPGRRHLLALPHQRVGEEGDATRYRAAVLDAEGAAASSAVQQCCVFVVPQGRESEWLFSSEEGQWQVASQCRCRRVILVSMERHQEFKTQAAVQKELSPLVKPLAPLDVRDIPGAIPIMTTQQGVGRRRVLATRVSPVTGQIVVEDVAIEEQGEATFVRRMVFVDHSCLIQSEACLQPLRSRPPQSGAGAKIKGKRGARNGEASKEELPELELDHSILPMNYHKQILAGLLTSSCLDSAGGENRATVLVIGLGGGGLPVFLSRHLQLSTRAVELSSGVKELAEECFGCADGPNLQIEVQDGLEALEESKAVSLDVIVVDAGSNDASQAISCPPAPFLEPAFLQNAAGALKQHGLLIVNCVTRSKTAFRQAMQSIQAVFPHVKVCEVEEDVNRIIFAAKDDKTLRERSLTRSAEEIAADHLKHVDSRNYDWLIQELSALTFRSA